jgi:hypothetical protein
MAIVAIEYMEHIAARESVFMKYGVCIQMFGFVALCLLRLQYQNIDLLLDFMPMLA